LIANTGAKAVYVLVTVINKFVHTKSSVRFEDKGPATCRTTADEALKKVWLYFFVATPACVSNATVELTLRATTLVTFDVGSAYTREL
jgi:hypothetical protein